MQEFSNSSIVNSENENTENFSEFCKKPREFTLLEFVWGFVCLFLGYVFCRTFPIVLKPLYSIIFLSLLYVSTVIALIFKKAKFGKAAIAVLISGFLVATGLFFSGNTVIHAVAFGYCLFAYCYFVAAATENRLEGGFSSYILMDFFKSVFVVPFCATGGILSAIFSKKSNKFGSVLGKVIVGIMVAIIPTAVVFSLLSFDGEFLRLFGNIFSFSIFDVISQIAAICFAFPIGAYLFRLFISSSDKSAKGIITLESCKKVSKDISIAPVITVFSAALPLLFVYFVFFVSQWKYYVSGFLGLLPENLDYATYARDGFFQLLTVSAINLGVIAAIGLFVKKGNRAGKISVRILKVIICIFTLVLISTAISKLVLYINEYGLTPKRVHAFWFMMVLTLIFISVILKQFITKIKLIPISVVITVVMFFALAVSGSNALIAKYNVNRYLDGSLDRMIVNDLEKLGDAAVPQYVRLEKELLSRVNTSVDFSENEYSKTSDELLLVELKVALDNYNQKRPCRWYEMTLPKILAKSAMEKRK